MAYFNYPSSIVMFDLLWFLEVGRLSLFALFKKTLSR